MAVLGVDACKDGWVGLVLDDGPVPRAVFAATIAELVEAAGSVEVVGIDIPIGLPVRFPRKADELAYLKVGPRRSSVFMTPPRAALEAITHADATRLAVELSGKGISRQAYALAPKILQVDRWLDEAGVRVVEVHPEVSFTCLAGSHLADAKTTWAGAATRRRVLADGGIVLEGDLGLSRRRVAADDVLDAAAAAWTARRVAMGMAESLPSPPEIVDRGRVAAIWY
jgi:predicted RNase H-like nuclease